MNETDTEMAKAVSDARPGQNDYHYVNEAGVPEDVMDELRSNRDIANAIELWSQELHQAAQANVPTIGLFTRHRRVDHKGTLAQMAQCAWAVENDDILSTLADVAESLTFQKVHFELFDPLQQDVWNQWAKMVNLDDFLRQANRELFKCSQVYVGLWWDRKVITVRKNRISDTLEELEAEAQEKEVERKERAPQVPGFEEPTPKLPEREGPGRGKYERPKKFPLILPTALTVFDPTKVVPVGPLMFNRERFAYVASDSEDKAFARVFDGEIADGTVLQLIESKYKPTGAEEGEFQDLGIDPQKLWLLKKNSVFRHTLTKANYERFAPVRLRSILPILEMKGHLRSSDRASLVGNTNFIIVVTKGTDKLPARPAEIENLQEQVKVIARLPVLVGDHRLNVEIVSPAMDNTLIESRWEVLDARLVFKALQTFQPTIQGGNASGGVKEMARIVGRGLESRRHMLVRSMERAIFEAVMEENEDVLDEFPSLEFTPRRISLDYSAELLNGVLKLRDRGDISRETTLEELDYDQDVEVLRRAREKVEYDSVFSSGVPHSSPAQNPFAPGGGAPPGQPQPAGANVGPKGQPRTEGGRPPGVTEGQPRMARTGNA